MKRPVLILFILLPLSFLSGYLLSKASLIGRTGINLFYKEYKFLKTWWQGALVVFILWVIVLFIHKEINRKLDGKARLGALFLALLAAVAGMFFTYIDFRETLTHKLLGERFHLGAYLFWLGWMFITVVYILANKKKQNRIA